MKVNISDIRSILQKPILTQKDHDDIWELINHMYRFDKELYIDKIIPYMTHFKDKLHSYIYTATHCEELEYFVQVAPFATCRYKMSSNEELKLTPSFLNVSALDLSSISVIKVIDILSYKYIRNIKHLSMGYIVSRIDDLRKIMSTPYISNLIGLHMEGIYLSTKEIGCILNTSELLNLKHLNLKNNEIFHRS